MYYVYAQTMEGRTQYGLVVCANVEDYLSGKIKKHELTRKDKEEDRMMHVRIQSANIEPVFLPIPMLRNQRYCYPALLPVPPNTISRPQTDSDTTFGPLQIRTFAGILPIFLPRSPHFM
jgi:hypothetical protein